MNIKTKLNIILVISIFVSLLVSAFVLKGIVNDFALSSSIDKARLTTKQLLAVRHYLSSIAQDIEVQKEGNPFIVSPAYVGEQVNKSMLQEHNFYIKQTSLHYRNIDNKPDAFEEKILKKYENKELEGDYSELSDYKNKKHLRYTYPLFIEKDCLQCHGEPYVDVNKNTYESLVALYGEEAFNYKIGDLRGIISIAIDIDDIEYTTDTINKNLYATLIILFIVIISLLLIDFKFIYIPQMKRIEEKGEQEKNAKEYLNVLTESNNNAIIAIDANKTILTFNKKAEEIFGFSKAEMIGTQNLLNIIPLKYKNMHTVASTLYLNTGQSNGILGTTLELEGLTKDGRVIPIRISFGNNDTENRIVVANIEDLTVEKEREFQQKEESEVAQAKLNKSVTLFGNNVIASSSDLNGTLTYVSQALCDISGYKESELLGQSNDILRATDMSSKVLSELFKTIKSGKNWKGEIKSRKKNEGHYWVSADIFPDFDKDKKIIGYSVIKHDITSEKVKDEFMANMSHELRTPLNAIIGFSGILNRKLKDEKNKDFISHINLSAEALLTLINDILDLSKIKDAKFTIEPYEFNAYKEILDYTKRFEGLTAKKELVFINNISTHLQAIFLGDWIRISQIILNIVSNSIKFTPEKGQIICDINYQHSNLVINISDNGIGMSKGVQDKIFQPFEQADGSTTRKYGGTGLGLSITQSLVELMNGKIELESKEGIGTTFTIILPLQKIQEIQEIPQIIIEDNLSPKNLNTHILVAEDNKTNQILVEMLLEEFGVTCDIANDGVEAIEMYSPEKHSMILMDENMPNMNGIEAMKIIKDKYKEQEVLVIALTANAMDGDKAKFLELGMDGYVSKPINEKMLFLCMSEMLAKHSISTK